MRGKNTTEGDAVVRVLIEHFDHQVERIAEGHTMLAGKMDDLGERLGRVEVKVDRVEVGLVALREEMRAGDGALRGEMHAMREELREEVRGGDEALRTEMHAMREELREEVAAFRLETRGEFAEVRSMIKLSYTELDTRVRRLETGLADVSVRLERIEKGAAP